MDLRRIVAMVALAAALAFVFFDQVPDSGFLRGHRGWVSAHTLAIAQKATMQNRFVGYAVSLETPAGRDLYYFDRYPVFFSTALHALQTAVPLDKAAEIDVARQAMDVVYALTVLAAVLLLVELGLAFEAAIAVAALAAAGSMMVEYRDMVHYDQPAVLGSVVLLWAIAAWSRGRRGRAVYVATALAVCMGRGYGSVPVLGLWWLFEAVRIACARRKGGVPRIPGAVRAILLGVPARACILGILVAGGCLAYNVGVESRVRQVAWNQTSIVQSATRRLSLDPQFNDAKERRLTWPHFLETQQENFVRTLLPWSQRDLLHNRRETGMAIAVVAAVLAVVFAASRQPEVRIPWLLMCLSGPLWLVLMRNLAAFHPYTAVFLFPATLVVFAAVLHTVAQRRQWVPALAACALLVVSTAQRNEALDLNRNIVVQETRDMERVAKVLEPGDTVTTDHRLFRGVPFALGFYLPDHDIVVKGPAWLVLTRQAKFRGRNLTPANRRIFLFHPDRPYRAHSPLARLAPVPGTALLPGPLPKHERRRGSSGAS